MSTYATIRELVEQEISPALSTGVGPGFDVDALVSALRDAGAIVHVSYPGAPQWDGWRLVTDDDGQIPGFWALVERLEAAADSERAQQ